MRFLLIWYCPVLAAAATAIAVSSRGTPWLAAAAAVVAVLAAGATLALAVRPPYTSAVAAAAAPLPVGQIREAFRSRAYGRIELVDILDQIERVGARPDLPIRSSEELAAFRRLSDSDFLRYLTSRVEAIEGTS